MQNQLADNNAAIYDLMVKACKQYDIDDSVQLGLFGFKIRDMLVTTTHDTIMPVIKYAQKRMTEFATKTKNTLDVGPCDGIVGKMTIAAGRKYLGIISDMKSFVGIDAPIPLSKLITPVFNEVTNNYNFNTLCGSVLFENFKFNKDIMIDQHILNNKVQPLVKRDISKVVEIVVHETVTDDTDKTVDVLRRRGFSTHFIIDAHESGNGVISQCAPIDKTCWHIGGKHNGRSIGIDIVNPYYPGQVNKTSKFKNNRVIKTKYAHQGEYIIPFDVQIRALYRLILALGNALKIDFINSVCEAAPENAGVFRFGSGGELSKIDRGVVSHWSLGGHADGVLPLYQAWRLTRGMEIDWDILDKK